ncbi:MAG TPA: hypothetical protein P5550_00880 [Bacteroidales bacterium]|nr:hypothetical protein [Bacteroidales bacterium]
MNRTETNGRRGGGWFGAGLLIGLGLGGFLVWLLISYYPFSSDRFLFPRSEEASRADRPSGAQHKTAVMDKTAYDTLGSLTTADSLDTPDSLDIFSFLDTVDWGVLDTFGAEYPVDTLRYGDFSRPTRPRKDTSSSAPLIPRDVRTFKGNPEVKRDIFLLARTIPVYESVTDSLGRNRRMETNDSPYKVDFWRSPVNYRGYRKSGRSLVVFGLAQPDSVRLERSGPNLYLEVTDKRYLITETYDFKHLVEVRGKNHAP